ncbi:MAG: type VI secretion system protein TssA [Desulfarculales bacterium]|jgi:type VI secretion system protein VasJ|nr:type VI secretion system protein TssA [Desulfarculales bacterium]
MNNQSAGHYCNIWLAPLSNGSYMGDDISFSPEFEELRDEVEKSNSLHSNAGTDWEIVLQQATELLADKSKDLWVLCYGIRAIYETGGLSACNISLAALSQLLQQNWQEIYPPASKIKRRCAPLEWLNSRFEQSLRNGLNGSGDPEVIGRFKLEITRIQNFLKEKMGESAPLFSNTLRVLPDNAVAEQRVKNPLNDKLPTPSNINSSTDIISSLEQNNGRVPAGILPQLIRATQEQAQQLAVHYLSLDILDWRAYLLHRAVLWCTINQLPQANSSKITPLRNVIPDEKIAMYASGVEAKRFSEVLPQLERSAAKAPYWFDGHYMVAKCLEGLQATIAQQFVSELLIQFLTKFPELSAYKFYDETPFMSAKTAQWVSEIQKKTNNSISDIFKDMNESADKNILNEAIDIGRQKGFQAGLAHLGNTHPGKNCASIEHGILKARYCIVFGKADIAIPLLQELYHRLEVWNLLDWDPRLSAKIIHLLQQVSPQGSLPENAMRRLHWLHLETVLALKEI